MKTPITNRTTNAITNRTTTPINNRVPTLLGTHINLRLILNSQFSILNSISSQFSIQMNTLLTNEWLRADIQKPWKDRDVLCRQASLPPQRHLLGHTRRPPPHRNHRPPHHPLLHLHQRHRNHPPLNPPASRSRLAPKKQQAIISIFNFQFSIRMREINNQLTGQIITLVCDTWGITRADLTGRSHRRPLPWARSQMCEYLRRYAGHDSVSCATILHVDPDTVLGYNKRYPHNLRTCNPNNSPSPTTPPNATNPHAPLPSVTSKKSASMITPGNGPCGSSSTATNAAPAAPSGPTSASSAPTPAANAPPSKASKSSPSTPAASSAKTKKNNSSPGPTTSTSPPKAATAS